MIYTRIYADENGDSHFEEVVIQLADKGSIGWLSENWPVRQLVFRENEPNYDWDFHTAPARKFIVLLDGKIEIESSLGVKRIFKGGDILLMEDVAGKGHRTRNIIKQTRRSLFLKL
jgi:hypothetical protein